MLNVPFDPLLLDKVQAYRQAESITGFFIPTQGVETSAQWPWYALFHGINTVWIDRPDAAMESLSQEFQVIRQGLDVLLDTADSVPAQLAIYENTATRLSLDEAGLEALRSAQQSLVDALQSAGVAYTFVSYTHLLDTGLSAYRVVVLPQVHALSMEEDVLLAQYVEQGGRLLADTLPGTLDENGQGVQEARDLRGKVTLYSLKEGFQEVATDFDLPSTHPTPVKKMTGDSKLHWFHHRYGEAELYSVLRYDDKSSLLALHIPEGFWGYDLLEGQGSQKSHTYTDLITPTLNDAGAGMVAYLPYRVSRLILELPEEISLGKRLNYSVTLKTFDALPGDHILFVRLLDDRGHSLKHYEHTVDYHAGEKNAEGYLPLALNETRGRYTLEVRDLLTGVSVSQVIDIPSIPPDEGPENKGRIVERKEKASVERVPNDTKLDE